jgi:hypothetical protein
LRSLNRQKAYLNFIAAPARDAVSVQDKPAPSLNTAKPERGGARYLICESLANNIGQEGEAGHGVVDEVLPAASWWVTLKESHFDIGTS